MSILDRISVTGPPGHRFDEILTPDALAFVAALDGKFAARRVELLGRRRSRRQSVAVGPPMAFNEETRGIREDRSWRVADPAPGLVDRRVEITGPPEPRMAVNALNSGAKIWMADFEDATAPTWGNIVGGQLTLIDAIEGKLDFTAGGKRYRVGPDPATIVVRPRGWHLVEKHLLVDGRPVSASLLDFGLYFYHCAQRQLDRGVGPYFYLPKLESHTEARLWNDVFNYAQDALAIPRGTIRATVLIETITAAFEMEEILFELREHSSGLNAGRWDYIFSVIKNLGGRGPQYVLPDRGDVTMTVPFMRAYTNLLVRTCHRRGAHAIGGMAAFIPSRRDPEVNARALEKVRQDKQRESGDGFDGSWVAHPDLVPVCREVFDAALGQRPHQLGRVPVEPAPSAGDLLAIPGTPGQVTFAGLRGNIRVFLRYVTAWLGGTGAVGIDGLMEDAATAEIARSQVWQWLRHGTALADGLPVDRALVSRLLDEESAAIRAEGGGRWLDAARAVFAEVAMGDALPEFFTTGAYARHLVGSGA